MDNRIIRTKSKTVRAVDENGNHVVSGVIPYGVLSEEMWLGYSEGSREKLQAGCFADWIKSNDVYANYAHNDELILGNTKSDTLALEDKEDGLHFSLTLGDSDIANRCYDTIHRGDCDTLSFEFTPHEWETSDGVTTLKKADLYAISLCVITPAYTQTQSQTIRSKRSNTMDEKKLDELSAKIDTLTDSVTKLVEALQAKPQPQEEEERDDEAEDKEAEATAEKELEELEKELEEELEELEKEEERDGEEESEKEKKENE